MKSLSDSPFVSFIKKGGGGWKIGILLAVGVILLLFGLSGTEESETQLYDEEQRLCALCERVKGAGDCYVMVGYSSEGSRYSSSSTRRVESVTVICEGADSITVKQQLTEIITSLYGIGANRVTIVKGR